MDPIEKRELKRQAFMRLAAQRRRAGLLRGRVVAISLVCFALLWGIVFVQMATGNDPVLSAKEAKQTSQTTASAKRAVNPAARRQRARQREEAELELEPEVRAGGGEFAEPETETEALGPELEEAEFEAAPEVEETAPEVEEEAAPEVEEVEPEFVEEEPLVTSQS